ETTALPYGLKLKAGQFFADFTRLGKVHSHDLPFTDRPLSLDRIIGGEDKARGLEFSWIPPIGHYIRLTGGIVDNIGADVPITSGITRLDGESDDFAFHSGDHRTFGDLMYYGRAATIFELGSLVNLNVGADYAHGRDRGARQIASGDFKLSWTPRPDSYDLFELSGEYLWSRTHGALSDDALLPGVRTTGSANAYGGYVYAQYKFGKSWQPGVRFDYLHDRAFGEQNLDGDGVPDGVGRIGDNVRTYSAYVNYHLSEFNRLRLEVSYIQGDQLVAANSRDDWQAFLQWTITLGPHKHPFSP
ncbi:MAG TPA: hypothetical protein VGO11_18505, partial [Chthoniobacteraceae bacterium]|nr:hypothetical protein [Chthoniobacteraceae bacterium]